MSKVQPLNSPQREIHRILFIRTDRMGDLLMNLPALGILRRTYPKAWIAVFLDRSTAELLTNHPDIDEVIVADARKLHGDFGYYWRTVRQIRKARFDLAVVSNPDKWWHLLTFFAGIPRRVGYRRKWSFFLTNTLARPKLWEDWHEIDLNLDLMRLLSGLRWDGKVSLPVDGLSKRKVNEKIAETFPDNKKFVAVHAGTSDPAKRWAKENFAEVCDRIRENGSYEAVLIGGLEEKAVSLEIQKLVRRPLVDWTGEFSLKELAAFFQHERVHALVSSDSGPVHVAWMSGLPVVALYAKNTPGSNPRRWGPKDAKSEVIFRPMDEISTQEVWEALQRTLERGSVKR